MLWVPYPKFHEVLGKMTIYAGLCQNRGMFLSQDINRHSN